MSAKKHILILSSWYPTEQHPFLGNFVKRQADLLSKEFRVTVIDCVSSNQNSEQIIEINDSYTEIIYRYKKSKFRVINLLRERKMLRKGLKKIGSVDFIHGHVMLPKAYWFWWAKKLLNAPLIITEHGSYFRNGNPIGFIQKYILRKAASHSNQLLAVSQRLKEDVLVYLPSAPISVVPNHIDSTVFIPRESPKTKGIHFLHISTLAAIKNCDEIIEAFQEFYLEHPTATLTIVSDENFNHFVQKTKNYSSKNSIHFVGPIEWYETVNYYQSADCFILNSTYESFSIVLAEAWSCGIPVIAPSVGIATYLASFLGIQSAGTDVKNVLEAMNAFSLRKDDFNAKKIRNHALQYSGERVLNQLKAIYEKI